MHMVRRLIEHGADVQTYGQTALGLAAADERAEKHKYPKSRLEQLGKLLMARFNDNYLDITDDQSTIA
jgi:hypothetical protein